LFNSPPSVALALDSRRNQGLRMASFARPGLVCAEDGKPLFIATVVCVPAPAGQGGAGAMLEDSLAQWMITHCLHATKGGAGAKLEDSLAQWMITHCSIRHLRWRWREARRLACAVDDNPLFNSPPSVALALDSRTRLRMGR